MKFTPVGERYGMLTVKSFLEVRNHRQYYIFTCDCGKEKIADIHNVKNGHIKSCGCLIHVAKYHYHNLHNTRLYTIMKDMKSRCFNERDKDFHNYGGRGITICNEWLEKKTGFLKFYNWAIENGYADNLTIDRIDVNKDYSPVNCRWVNMKTQSNNKRTNFYITYNDKTKTLKEWAEEYNICPATLARRIKAKWPVDLALTMPTNSKRPLSTRV